MSDTIEKFKRHPWIIVKDIDGIPSLTPRNTDGYVYCLEFGSHVKIGMTKDIRTRMQTLKSSARNYGGFSVGRIAYTLPHERYQQNEKTLHKLYKSIRVRGELFAIPFDHIPWHALPVDLTALDKRRSKHGEQTAAHEVFVDGESDMIKSLNEAVEQAKKTVQLMRELTMQFQKKMYARTDGLIDVRSLTSEELNAMDPDEIANKVLFPVDIVEKAVAA